MSFDVLLESSDIVVVSCALTASTRGLFDDAAFHKMKAGSVFVNIARGGVVDQPALQSVLESGHLGAAGLDVTDPEPLPPGHSLLSLPRCVVTPHIASATHKTRRAMAEIAARNLLAGLEGAAMVAEVK